MPELNPRSGRRLAMRKKRRKASRTLQRTRALMRLPPLKDLKAALPSTAPASVDAFDEMQAPQPPSGCAVLQGWLRWLDLLFGSGMIQGQ